MSIVTQASDAMKREDYPYRSGLNRIALLSVKRDLLFTSFTKDGLEVPDTEENFFEYGVVVGVGRGVKDMFPDLELGDLVTWLRPVTKWTKSKGLTYAEIGVYDVIQYGKVEEIKVHEEYITPKDVEVN